MQTAIKSRNMSIELMRCCMMFGIVLDHIMTQDGWFAQGGPFVRQFINLLGGPGVVGFVFISGYYGIRYSKEKAFRLLALFAFYTIVFAAPNYDWSYVFGHRLTHNWFLFAYLVLMLFAPVFNAALEGKSKQQVLGLTLPILVAVFGWSYLNVIPGIKDYVPVVTGFGSLSFFTLFGVYMAARTFRLLELERFLCGKVIVLVGAIAMAAVFIGFHHNNCVATLVLCACLFVGFSRIQLMSTMSKIVAWVAPTTFGIFLLHSTLAGYWVRRTLIEFVATHCGVYAGYIITTIVVFCACCVVDKLRKAILLLFRQKIMDCRSRRCGDGTKNDNKREET